MVIHSLIDWAAERKTYGTIKIIFKNTVKLIRSNIRTEISHNHGYEHGVTERMHKVHEFICSRNILCKTIK